MHGIIKINTTCRGELHSPNNPERVPTTGKLHSPNVPPSTPTGECNSPLRGPSNTVGAIIRGYKSSVTKQLGLLGFDEKCGNATITNTL